MRFNKWPFRRFSLLQLFVDIRNNSSKSFVCPVTSGGETEHTLLQSKMYSLPPLPPLSLPGVRAPLSAECVCAVHGSSGCCRGTECAGPSPTRMGETAPRRCKQQDHRPIAFSGKRWSAGVALVPSPVQCPHTCRPGFLAAEKFWVLSAGSARLQWGVCAGWRLGPSRRWCGE